MLNDFSIGEILFSIVRVIAFIFRISCGMSNDKLVAEQAAPIIAHFAAGHIAVFESLLLTNVNVVQKTARDGTIPASLTPNPR